MSNSKTGTREWSEHSVNCCLGCAHECLYCYAREGAMRWGRVRDGADWAVERPITDEQARTDPKYGRRYQGVVMFPTTHDWTEGTMNAGYVVLKRLLEAGNRVLLVSKLGYDHVNGVLAAWDHCGMFDRRRLEIRISIGGLDEDTRTFWEPGAPTFDERLIAMAALRDEGFRVTASLEPLLEPQRALELVTVVEGYGCEQMWIGKLNHLHKRTAWRRQELVEQAKRETLAGKGSAAGEAFREFDRHIRLLDDRQADVAVLCVYDELRTHPMVRWKDSYREVIERHGHTIERLQTGVDDAP